MVEIKEFEGNSVEYITSTIFHIEEPKEQEEQMIFEFKSTYVEIDSATVVIPSNVEEPEEEEGETDEEDEDDREYLYQKYIIEFPETPRDLEVLYPNEIEEALYEELLNVYEVELDNDAYVVKPTGILLQKSVEPEGIDSATVSSTESEIDNDNENVSESDD